MLCVRFWPPSAFQAELLVFTILAALIVIVGIAYYKVHHGSDKR